MEWRLVFQHRERQQGEAHLADLSGLQRQRIFLAEGVVGDIAVIGRGRRKDPAVDGAQLPIADAQDFPVWTDVFQIGKEGAVGFGRVGIQRQHRRAGDLKVALELLGFISEHKILLYGAVAVIDAAPYCTD